MLFLIPLSYLLISGYVIYKVYIIERSPKQMFREVAGYLDGKFDSKRRILIIEPEGPMIFGVAYYLQNNFKLHSFFGIIICNILYEKAQINFILFNNY